MANSSTSQRALTQAGIFVFVLMGSIFLGSAVGREDTQTALIAVSAIILVAMFVGLGKHVWVVVPLFASWTGSVPILPLPFSASNLAVGFACSAWVLMLATRKLKSTYRFEIIDMLIFITLCLLALGYYRNPVGLGALRSGSNVGARPYVEIVIGVVGYLMLASQRPKLSVVEGLPKWAVVSAAIIAIGGSIAYFLPGVGMVMYQFYSGFKPNVGALLNPNEVNDTVGRAGFLRPFAYLSAAYVGARCFPLKVLSPRQWGFLVLLLVASIFALLSGFRSSLLTIAFYFIFACWLWKRLAGLFICIGITLVGIIGVVAIQEVTPLPHRLQRTLSFLPGNWDHSVKVQAEGSVDWRVEMWEIVLEGDSIQNWWVGDGFGFPRSEMEYFSAASMTGELTPNQLAEYYMITGALHSGPLSAAKFVGVIGFVLYLILAIVIAYRFIKLWAKFYRSSSSIQLHITVGFFTIQAAYIPFEYVFIFGAYSRDLAPLILSAGILRLLETVTKDHFQEISRSKGELDKQMAEAV